MSLPTFVLNDESKKNSHGFFLINSGGRFERFNDNPVMLDHHALEHLIGKWKNLRIEGLKLVADPDFDEGVELGAQRKGQVERGYLKGASPGILPLAAEYREDPITGDTDLYVTQWELIEGSTASVPSNAGALTLKIYGADQQPIADQDVRLHMENIVKLSAESKAPGVTSKINKMEKITLTAAALVCLGLTDGADMAAISTAIVKLHKENGDNKTALDLLKTAETKRVRDEAAAKVRLAIKEGRATADQENDLIELAVEKPELADKLLGGPKKLTLSEQVEKITGADIASDRKDWTVLKWIEKDPEGWAKLKAENPAAADAVRKVKSK